MQILVVVVSSVTQQAPLEALVSVGSEATILILLHLLEVTMHRQVLVFLEVLRNLHLEQAIPPGLTLSVEVRLEVPLARITLQRVPLVLLKVQL